MKEETVPSDVESLKSDLKAALERIKKLENPGIPTRTKRVTEHVAHLRMWEDQLVVKVGQIKENYELPESSPKRMLWDITVLDDKGKEKEITVNYPLFSAHAPKVKVKFLKLEQKERLEVDPEKGGGGYGAKRGKTAEGMETGAFGELSGVGLTGEEVPLEVGFLDTEAQVEVLQGAFKGTIVSFTQETINALNI